MTKYSKEITEELCSWIRIGNTAKDSAALCGIGESTFYEWKEKHPEFAESIKAADILCKAENIKKIQLASDKDWKASAWWLERKYKKEFAQRMEETGADGAPIENSLTVTFKSSAS